jgi:proteasome lid subunit RPN8/RPN11
MTKIYQTCKFCGNPDALIMSSSIPGQTIVKCAKCKHTYTYVNGDNMSKKRNLKKKKNKTINKNNLAVQNQKKINKTNGFNKTLSSDEPWEVEIDCVEACSKTPDKIDIWFLPLAKRKVDVLMKEYKNIEWLAYLLGKKGTREIIDLFIPNQNISSARVDNIQCEEYNDLSVIGVIHSHHSMGHNFSSTDNEWINQNHDISLCISHNGIGGQYRYKTPCGAFKIIDVNTRLKIEIDFDEKQFIESIKDKLKERTYTNTYYPSGYYQGENYGWGNREWDNKNNTWVYKNNIQKVEDTKNKFLTNDEIQEIEKEVEELNFEKDLTLAEELEMLEEINNQDDKETN